MGVTLIGFSDLTVSLRNIAERSSAGVRGALDHGAKEIQALAVRQAPVDEGDLENSIKVESFRDLNDSAGRKVFTIYVDEDVPADNGKTVGDYAMLMHEGDYNLGPKSEAKQSANPDIIVGPKFLERAVELLEDEIGEKAKNGLLKGIGK